MNKKNIIFISSFSVFGGNSAGAARMRNYAKALTLSKNTNVYIFSLINGYKIDFDEIHEIEKGIFQPKQTKKIKDYNFVSSLKYRFSFFTYFLFFKKVYSFLRKKDINKKVFLIYPESRASFELVVLFYFKFLKKQKIYYEANEVRKFTSANFVTKNNLIGIFFKLFDILYHSIAEYFTTYYNGLIVISTNMFNYHRKNNGNLLRVPILSDVKKINYETPLPFYNRKEFFNICFTGTINHKKEGLDTLYNIIANISKEINVKLHLYGNFGNSEDFLKKLSQSLKISENIIYHGSIPNHLLISEMRKYHLLILPRPYSLQINYGFSTKLSEYLISGVPVLVTNVSDNGMYIIDGINGYIVPADKTNLMESKIRNIITYYNDNVESIVKNAYETVYQSFDYRNYSTYLNDFLR